MTSIDSAPTTIQLPDRDFATDEAQLAAAAFLARYSSRTLDAYRHDLRGYFNWTASVGLPVLEATRPHIELYRAGSRSEDWLRRPSTGACRRYAASTALPTSTAGWRRTRLSTCADPRFTPLMGAVWDRSELGRFLFAAERYDHDHAALAVLLGLNGLRVSEACATSIKDLGSERGHRILRIVGKGNKPAVIPLVPRTARTIDLAVGERCEGPILCRRDGERLDQRTAHRWIRSIGKRAGLGLTPSHAQSRLHHGRP